MLNFDGERIVPEAGSCEPLFALKMYQEHSARYLFASQATPGRSVLDVGCGVGYGSQLLATRGAESVTAFDLSAEAIKHALTYYPHRNLFYLVASAEDFAFGRKFDVVTCFELIEHVQNQHRAIENIASALIEDGLLIISTPRPLDKVRSAFHERELSLLDFSRILGCSFPYVEWFFENNHFASLVAGSAPKTLERIYALHPQFDLGQADYFIAVASRRPIDRSLLRDQLVLNNDAYVRNLERDVAILHQVEDELKQKLEVVSAERQLQVKEVAAEPEGAPDPMIEDLQRKLARANASLRRAQRRHKDDVSTWRDAVLERDAQIKAIYQSRSWRITEPIRSLAAAVRGGSNGSALGVRPLVSDSELMLPAAGIGQPVAIEDQSPMFGATEVQDPSKAASRRSYLDVLYIVGCHDGESKRYRVHNLVDGLNRLGYSTASVRQDEIPNMIHGCFSANIVVLFRCAFDAHVGHLLKYCQKNKIETIFDIDDLVFEPENIELVHVVKTFNEAERALYKNGVERYRKTLLSCDRATCTTAFLAQRIEQLGKRADVIPNSLNVEQLSIACALPLKDARDPREVRIGYFSGSNTHQVDFESCESALLVVMDSRPEVRFVLGGLLELEPEWTRFSDRIERHPMLPHGEMLKVISTVDINLAPLELGNPYAHCKSQLKIFEAGVVRVPTIASATESYSEAIDSGHDGFLASSPEEWLSVIEQLVKSPDLRRSMGERARQRSLSSFGPEVVAQRAERVYDFFTGEIQVGS